MQIRFAQSRPSNDDALVLFASGSQRPDFDGLGAIGGALDRQRFEVFCYANVRRPDDVTRHLQGLADQWRDISRVPDDRAALPARGRRLGAGRVDLSQRGKGGAGARVI